MDSLLPPSGPVEQKPKIDDSDRTETLHQLFGLDVDFLRVNGDLDKFEYDPETGRDGLLHMLIGDAKGGFHSESAVDILNENSDDAGSKSGTYIDRSGIPGKDKSSRAYYNERLFEPHGADVVVRGAAKVAFKKTVDGSEALKSIRNGMYPKEYDPTAIVRAVSIAYDSLDLERASLRESNEGDFLVVDGVAPMLDGEAQMPIRFFLDPQTRKILTAYPLLKRGGYMNLTAEKTNYHLHQSNTRTVNTVEQSIN